MVFPEPESRKISPKGRDTPLTGFTSHSYTPFLKFFFLQFFFFSNSKNIKYLPSPSETPFYYCSTAVFQFVIGTHKGSRNSDQALPW
jgi:hypothetical protein